MRPQIVLDVKAIISSHLEGNGKRSLERSLNKLNNEAIACFMSAAPSEQPQLNTEMSCLVTHTNSILGVISRLQKKKGQHKPAPKPPAALQMYLDQHWHLLLLLLDLDPFLSRNHHLVLNHQTVDMEVGGCGNKGGPR